MKVFTYDGETFPLADDPKQWTIGESLDVAAWLGIPMENANQMQTAAAALAVSIRRKRSDFPFDDILNVPTDVLFTAREVKVPTDRAPADEAASGVVLSPSSAGRSRPAAKRPARKRTA